MLKRLLTPLTRFPKYTIPLLLRGIYFGLMGSAVWLLVKMITDALAIQDRVGFRNAILWVGLLFALRAVPGHYFRNSSMQNKNAIQARMYVEYLQQYALMDNTFTEKLGTGKSNSIIQKGLDNWANLLRSVPQETLVTVLSILVGLGVVGYQFGRVGIGAVIVLLLASVLAGLLGNKKALTWRKAKRKAYTEADKHVVKYIMTKFEVLLQNRVGYEMKKLYEYFDRVSVGLYGESLAMILTFDWPRIALDTVRVGLGLYIGWGIMEGRYTVGDFILVRGLLKVVSSDMQQLTGMITDWSERMIYINRLWELFDETPTIVGYDQGKQFAYVQGAISLMNINFAYESTPVLSQFSLAIPGGSSLALVGASGSGKSTLVKLIAGFIRPDSGQVVVDGQDLTSVSLKTFYSSLGYLPQEPSVFDGTVRENLLYGSVGTISDTLLQDAINRAQCGFINKFSEGLDTEIGERGIRLSGGQRQRLAIAKLFISDPKIIILDEPTSALDSFSEDEITKAMSELFKGRTTIIVAHRLQTVKGADTIVVMSEGAVVETGSHDELIKKGGTYRAMVELQSGF